MRCILGFCAAAFPIATSFAVRPGVSHRHTAVFRSASESCFSVAWWKQQHPDCRRQRCRRAAAAPGSGKNLDSSDDADDSSDADAEIYASLRRRLEELEKSSPVPAAAAAEDRVEATPQASAREREFTIPKESPEDKRRSRALLTIQSVGVISAALSFGTLALYWLAGSYFVHLGPREYPGSMRGGGDSTAAIERAGGVAAGGEEDGGAPSARQAPARRTLGGSSTREAFQFEGFPDAVKGSDVVPPDF